MLAAQPIQVSQSILNTSTSGGGKLPPNLLSPSVNVCVLGGLLQPSGALSQAGLGASNPIISWQTYSIGEGGGVTYTQPSTSSQTTKTFNLGNTQILGTLVSNGSPFVVLQNGVITGPGPALGAGSLTIGGITIAP